MMSNLELKPPVKPIQPFVAIDIETSFELVLDEGM
jgi:hypothetical protein